MNSRHCMRFVAITSAVGLSLLFGPTANADLILNGSFEAPSPLDPCTPALQCSGSFRNFNAGDSFEGWSVVGAGQMSLGSTDFIQLGFSFPAQDGQQWADLSGFGGNDPVGVQQDVTTAVGEFYDLSFWIGNVVDTTFDLYGVSSAIEVFINGATLGTFSNTGGDTTTNWQQFSVSFQADSTTSSITFFNRDSATDNMNGLDNVVLTSRAVPEPGTLALFAAGLLGFGLTRRQRAV